MSDELLVVRDLTKAFPGTLALDHVDLTLRAGRITCLAGHNGSGKSTLVKILAGVHRADSGSVTTPSHSDHDEALHFIHQDLGLIEGLTTVENLDLGQRLGRRALSAPKRSAERRRAEELLRRFGVELDVTTRLANLSPAQRTMVAIARALSAWTDDRQVLVLDEPTAALHDREAEVVLEVTRRIADRGAAVLFISHRLEELERLGDDVVVLRDGRVAATRERGDFTADTLIELIAGRELDEPSSERPTAARDHHDPRLKVHGITGRTLAGIDLTVRAGEVVGVSGVIGSGVDDLLGTVFGGQAPAAGTVQVDGTIVPAGSSRRAIAAGIGFVPRDRHRHGAVMALAGRENLTLPRMGDLRTRWGSLSRRRENREARHWFGHAAVHPGDPERPFAQFSGGNQQKIVLSRWMRTEPKVLLLEEPTQGVDVGAQDAIYDLVREMAARGTAVLVASSDTKELVGLCDRVIVLSDGRISAELSGERLTEATLVRHTLATTTPAGRATAVATEES